MIRVSQIRLELKDDVSVIPNKISKLLRVAKQDILELRIYKESIDARKGTVKRIFTVDVAVKNEMKILAKNKKLMLAPDLSYKESTPGTQPLKQRPIIIGFGPAGMFTALILAQAGYQPIVIERGEAVDERTKTINTFWEKGQLNTESNVQFGEGGAGTFSDGKLTTRIKDPRCRKVLEELVHDGAPEEILYKNKPHIGTDKLKPTVKALRERIIKLGGEVRFNSKMEKLLLTDGKVSGIKLSDGAELKSDIVIMAMGHSSRDTFEMLHEVGVDMQAKPFAVGVRIEHPQDMIDKVQYSSDTRPEGLGAAEYKLTYQTKEGRAVYTFCMCPGGYVVASSSEEGGVVVNGMSEFARDQDNANSALLVSVTPDDFKSTHPLAGVELQRELEQKAFQVGGKNYSAPVQLVGDFLKGTRSTIDHKNNINPSYKPSVVGSNFNDIFPEFMLKAMREGIIGMDKRIQGFARPDAILTAVESRSSSPVRIHRNEESFESLSTKGLYPCGEGAGYAGGIMSSAVDGIRVAEKIIEKYKFDVV